MRTSVLSLAVLVLVSLLVVNLSEAQVRGGKFGVGIAGSYFIPFLDYEKAKPSYGGSAELSYHLIDNFSLRGSFGYVILNAEAEAPFPELSTSMVWGNLSACYDILPNSSVNPFIYVGANGIYYDPKNSDGDPLLFGSSRVKSSAVGGLGLDIFASEFVSFTIVGEGYLPVTDKLDARPEGDVKDFSVRIYLGVKYYFFDQAFLTKMLKAVEERYKK